MRRYALLAALCLLALACLPAGAEAVGTAWRTAALYVPASAMPVGMREEPDGFFFTFEDELKGHRYEVRIGLEHAGFLQRTLLAYNRAGSPEVSLQAGEVGGRVHALRPGTSLESLFLSREGASVSYLAVYAQQEPGYLYRGYYSASDGEILYEVMKPAAPAGEGLMTLEQAKAAAVAQFPGGRLLDLSFERVGAGNLYIAAVFLNGQEYHLTLDAQSGALLGYSSVDSSLLPQDGVVSTAAAGAEDEWDGWDELDDWEDWDDMGEMDDGDEPEAPVSASRTSRPAATRRPAPRPTAAPRPATTARPAATATPIRDDDDDDDDDDDVDDDDDDVDDDDDDVDDDDDDDELDDD